LTIVTDLDGNDDLHDPLPSQDRPDTPPEQAETYLSAAQVATLTRRHKRVVIGWVQSCQLPVAMDEATEKYRIALSDLLTFMERYQPTDTPSEQDIWTQLNMAISYCIEHMADQIVNSLEYERYRAAAKSISDALKSLNGEQDETLLATLAQIQESLVAAHIPQREPSASSCDPI
jgi:hypothetical protein